MPAPPPRRRGSLALLQVRLAVRAPDLEPAVAPGLHVQVQLLHCGGVEQHLPRRHPLVQAPVQRCVLEGIPGIRLSARAQHPPQVGGRRVDAADGVLAVAAEAVHVEPFPALVDRIGHEQTVAPRVPRRGGGVARRSSRGTLYSCRIAVISLLRRSITESSCALSSLSRCRTAIAMLNANGMPETASESGSATMVSGTGWRLTQ